MVLHSMNTRRSKRLATLAALATTTTTTTATTTAKQPATSNKRLKRPRQEQEVAVLDLTIINSVATQVEARLTIKFEAKKATLRAQLEAKQVEERREILDIQKKER